ncbi:MAG TPA: aryl-sulfate sulfotransferase [Alphaproteobacteria bacterium]|jgi:outer membrane protein assembly factor BamB|nr:aryl-sulfate sulfotransferase [Alphaproteobacteria bacterium]
MRIRDIGLVHHDEALAEPGYTVIAPLRGCTVYLVGMRGEIVHRWQLPDRLGTLAYLLPGGNLLTSGMTTEGPPIIEGKGGHLREFDWEGRLVWEHVDHAQHHDFRRLANGNTLYLGWEKLSDAEKARVTGGVPGTARKDEIYADFLKEVTPDGKVVWEWHARELEFEKYPLADDCWRWEFAHANSCAPTNDGDVLINFRHLDMMAIIDRRTKRFVWERRDPSWGHQHNAEMLPNGNITFFANGVYNLIQPFCSRAVEIDPRTGAVVWEYKAPQSWTFFSPIISGVQRLSGGNTLICDGMGGRVLEVTPQGELAWEYVCPFFAPVFPGDGPCNALFRAYRYAADSPEIGGRLQRL